MIELTKSALIFWNNESFKKPSLEKWNSLNKNKHGNIVLQVRTTEIYPNPRAEILRNHIGVVKPSASLGTNIYLSLFESDNPDKRANFFVRNIEAHSFSNFNKFKIFLDKYGKENNYSSITVYIVSSESETVLYKYGSESIEWEERNDLIINWLSFKRGLLTIDSKNGYYTYLKANGLHYFLYPSSTKNKNRDLITYEVIPDIWINEIVNKSFNGYKSLTSNDEEIVQDIEKNGYKYDYKNTNLIPFKKKSNNSEILTLNINSYWTKNIKNELEEKIVEWFSSKPVDKENLLVFQLNTLNNIDFTIKRLNKSIDLSVKYKFNTTLKKDEYRVIAEPNFTSDKYLSPTSDFNLTTKIAWFEKANREEQLTLDGVNSNIVMSNEKSNFSLYRETWFLHAWFRIHLANNLANQIAKSVLDRGWHGSKTDKWSFYDTVEENLSSHESINALEKAYTIYWIDDNNGVMSDNKGKIALITKNWTKSSTPKDKKVYKCDFENRISLIFKNGERLALDYGENEITYSTEKNGDKIQLYLNQKSRFKNITKAMEWSLENEQLSTNNYNARMLNLQNETMTKNFEIQQQNFNLSIEQKKINQGFNIFSGLLNVGKNIANENYLSALTGGANLIQNGINFDYDMNIAQNNWEITKNNYNMSREQLNMQMYLNKITMNTISSWQFLIKNVKQERENQNDQDYLWIEEHSTMSESDKKVIELIKENVGYEIINDNGTITKGVNKFNFLNNEIVSPFQSEIRRTLLNPFKVI